MPRQTGRAFPPRREGGPTRNTGFPVKEKEPPITWVEDDRANHPSPGTKRKTRATPTLARRLPAPPQSRPNPRREHLGIPAPPRPAPDPHRGPRGTRGTPRGKPHRGPPWGLLTNAFNFSSPTGGNVSEVLCGDGDYPADLIREGCLAGFRFLATGRGVAVRALGAGSPQSVAGTWRRSPRRGCGRCCGSAWRVRAAGCRSCGPESRRR